MVATINMFSRNEVIAYVGQHAADYGLDPAALLSVANHEGLNTSPGSKWWLPKESNWSFGPPSWYGNGAGAHILGMFGGNADQASAWSWSPDGLNYWLQQVAVQAPAAVGATGVNAISAIVHGFERPREDLVQGEINNASHDYSMFQQAIGGGVQTPLPPGQVQPPAQAQPPVQTEPTTPAKPTAGLLPLGQVGPFKVGVPTGLLLGLIAIVLLLIGAIIIAGPDRITKTATMVIAPEAGVTEA